MEQVIAADGRYPMEAIMFLHEGLNRAVKEATDKGHGRHVTGQELCFGLRDEAIDRWGMMVSTVLKKWNVTETIDFGNMVYLLIENDYMHKTETDSIEDFRDVYDFDKTFNVAGKFDLKE